MDRDWVALAFDQMTATGDYVTAMFKLGHSLEARMPLPQKGDKSMVPLIERCLCCKQTCVGVCNITFLRVSTTDRTPPPRRKQKLEL